MKFKQRWAIVAPPASLTPCAPSAPCVPSRPVADSGRPGPSVQPMRQLAFLWICPANGNCCRGQTAASQSM